MDGIGGGLGLPLSLPLVMLGGRGGGKGRVLCAGAERRGGGGGGIPLACVGLGGLQRAKSLAQSEKAWSTRTSMRSAFSSMGGGRGGVVDFWRLGLRCDQGGAGGLTSAIDGRFGGGGGGVLGMAGASATAFGTPDPIISLSSWAKD